MDANTADSFKLLIFNADNSADYTVPGSTVTVNLMGAPLHPFSISGNKIAGCGRPRPYGQPNRAFMALVAMFMVTIFPAPVSHTYKVLPSRLSDMPLVLARPVMLDVIR